MWNTNNIVFLCLYTLYSADAVFRLDNAPTLKYEPLVGTKTTFQLVSRLGGSSKDGHTNSR